MQHCNEFRGQCHQNQCQQIYHRESKVVTIGTRVEYNKNIVTSQEETICDTNLVCPQFSVRNILSTFSEMLHMPHVLCVI